jgi:uncharacterized protein (TIGR00369 family)
MRKISNPFAEMASKGEYNCFGCSPANEIGLHLGFWEDDNEVLARWNPDKKYEGWMGVLHGGIQATLLDEVAAWVVFVKLKTAGVTSEIKVKYHKPLYLSKGEVSVRGRLIKTEKRLAQLECALFDGESELCAAADVTYFCFPEKIARAKYNYPGVEAFTGESSDS